MIVIDNFLDDELCDSILYRMINSHNFPWFYSSYSLADKNLKPLDNKSMFQHNFFLNNIESNEYNLIFPLVNKVKSITNTKDTIRIKTNLYINTSKQETHSKHIDVENLDKFTTAIFYLTDTNGFTTIGDQVIKDKKNRLVYFDGNTPHFGTTQNDKKERVLINFNLV